MMMEVQAVFYRFRYRRFFTGPHFTFVWVLLLMTMFLGGCNISFFHNGWKNAIYGTTVLDKELFIKFDRLNKEYAKKTLEVIKPNVFVETKTMKYIILHEDNKLYIFFMGTKTPSDVYYNFTQWKEPAWKTQYENIDIRVHSGFYRPYRLAADADIEDGGILAVVGAFLEKNPASSDPRIYIVGHSSGGAKAALSAFDLAVEFPHIAKNIYCLMGGAPAPGNAVFATELKKLLNPGHVVSPRDKKHRMMR